MKLIITINGECWSGAWSYKNKKYSFRTVGKNAEQAKHFYDIASAYEWIKWIRERISKRALVVIIHMSADESKKQERNTSCCDSKLPNINTDCSEYIIPDREYIIPVNRFRPTMNEDSFYKGYYFENPTKDEFPRKPTFVKSITEICKEADEHENNWYVLNRLMDYITINHSQYTNQHFAFMIEHISEKADRLRAKNAIDKLNDD